MLAHAVGGAAGPRSLVEIDSGHHRSGVSADQAGEVAEAAPAAGLDVVGVFTFPGHSYGPGAQRSLAAADEANALEEAATALAAQRLRAGVRSGGSTPSAAVQPTRACSPSCVRASTRSTTPSSSNSVAATGPTRVERGRDRGERRPGTIILDSGGKVLGADRKDWDSAAGRLPDFPEARSRRAVRTPRHRRSSRPAPNSPRSATIVRVCRITCARRSTWPTSTWSFPKGTKSALGDRRPRPQYLTPPRRASSLSCRAPSWPPPSWLALSWPLSWQLALLSPAPSSLPPCGPASSSPPGRGRVGRPAIRRPARG